MPLLHPFALVGLAALAGPILVHLLMRREAVRVPFPTLRFLPATRSASIRRHRLSDWALLAVRLTALALAALALADPVLVRLLRAAAARRVSRAIVVDGSASMDRRAATGGDSLRAAARAAAADLAKSATTSTTIEGRDLAASIAAACDWLARVPPSRREVVAISDFQRRAFDAATLGCVPPDAGITLRRLDAGVDRRAFDGQRLVRGGSEVLVSVTPLAEATGVAYVPTGATIAPPSIDLLAGADERPAAEAAMRAVIDTGVPSGTSARPIAIVCPQAPERAPLKQRTTALTQPWMWDVVRRLDRAGFHLATAADRDRLVVFLDTPAASLTTAAAIQAVLAARSAFPYEEREPDTWDAPALGALQRPGGEPPATLFRNETTGTGRPIWVLVLAVLGVETWMRRPRRVAAPSQEPVRERVA